MRILLADDSVTAQNMGKKILAEAGHEVVCVSNGAAALKKVTEQQPDLVILDIYMPGYSGLEVCQRLKEGNATAQVPVVLTVGKLEPFRKEEAQRVHAEALIVKPFEASELAAAVSRFAEIAAAKPSKTKNKGKLGPKPEPKPQWEEAPEDEFVNTTQRLQERMEDEEAAKVSSSPSSEKAEERQPEVEAFAGDGQHSYAAPPQDAGEQSGSAPFVHTGLEESSRPESAPEFSVTPHEEFSPAGETEGQTPLAAKAAAAAAGGEGSQLSPAAGSPESFAVNAPAEAAAETSSYAAPSSRVEPEMISGLGSELSAAADSMVVPSVDPAFDPDRTQWASQYATRFGLVEEETEASEETQAIEETQPAEALPAEPQIEPAGLHTAAPAEPQSFHAEPQAAPPAETEASPAGPADEISAILNNLPGGMPATEAQPAEPPSEVGQRPWPLDSSEQAAGWKAEEVPVEDHDSSVSLADEMEKAFRAADSGLRVQFAEPEQEPDQEVSTSPAGGQESEPAPLSAPAAWESASQPSSPFVPPPEEPVASKAAPETKSTQAEPDRVAGVMQSAAMAIATRATISAVTSQLHTPPAEGAEAATGPSAIEELVGQVLERLKPKLIAEVKRELETSDEK